jgi:hypothetical protein
MDLLAELRRRLDVDAAALPDELLTHMLEVSAALIAPWLAPERIDPDPLQPLVDEATVQLAVKVIDVSPRGVITPDGELLLPASATPGLVRSVFGVLGPALHTGGLSV